MNLNSFLPVFISLLSIVSASCINLFCQKKYLLLFMEQGEPLADFVITKTMSEFWKPRNGDFQVSVLEFGAIGDGICDDTKSIQRAIDYIAKVGHGIIYFPAGIFKVSVNSSTDFTALLIDKNIILKGATNQKSVIKLADNQGNFNAILGGRTFASDLSNFAMYDLAVDENGTMNPVLSEDAFKDEKQRFALRIYKGSGIHIERCRFTNQHNADVITVNGENVSNIFIRNNSFESIGGGRTDYDHSTIYTLGKSIEISNNIFSSKFGAGTTGSRTAIEIHGDNHLIKNNVIRGYTNGVNFTGFAKTSNHNIVIDNVIMDAYTGITIWSFIYPNSSPNQPAIANGAIAHNKISLNVDGWRKLWGSSSSVGIALEPGSNAPIQNLNIVGNTIFFAKSLTTGSSDQHSTGIRLWRSLTPNVKIESIHLSDNKIINPLAAGIYISLPMKQAFITNNTIINPGRGRQNFSNDYRYAILIDGDFEDVAIDENHFIENQIISKIEGGILSSAYCHKNCQANENTLKTKASKKLKIFKAKDSSKFDLKF